MGAPAVLATRSEVTVDAQGVVWLAPRRTSLLARHTAASFVIALAILAVTALLTLLPGLPGMAASVPLVAGGIVLVLATARGAGSKVGLSELGVIVLSGTTAVQLGWPAVASVRGDPVGRRVRIILGSREGEVASRATFERAAAREWLDRARAEADRRRLNPRPAESGLGFVTG